MCGVYVSAMNLAQHMQVALFHGPNLMQCLHASASTAANNATAHHSKRRCKAGCNIFACCHTRCHAASHSVDALLVGCATQEGAVAAPAPGTQPPATHAPPLATPGPIAIVPFVTASAPHAQRPPPVPLPAAPQPAPTTYASLHWPPGSLVASTPTAVPPMPNDHTPAAHTASDRLSINTACCLGSPTSGSLTQASTCGPLQGYLFTPQSEAEVPGSGGGSGASLAASLAIGTGPRLQTPALSDQDCGSRAGAGAGRPRDWDSHGSGGVAGTELSLEQSAFLAASLASWRTQDSRELPVLSGSVASSVDGGTGRSYYAQQRSLDLNAGEGMAAAARSTTLTLANHSALGGEGDYVGSGSAGDGNSGDLAGKGHKHLRSAATACVSASQSLARSASHHKPGRRAGVWQSMALPRQSAPLPVPPAREEHEPLRAGTCASATAMLLGRHSVAADATAAPSHAATGAGSVAASYELPQLSWQPSPSPLQSVGAWQYPPLQQQQQQQRGSIADSMLSVGPPVAAWVIASPVDSALSSPAALQAGLQVMQRSSDIAGGASWRSSASSSLASSCAVAVAADPACGEEAVAAGVATERLSFAGSWQQEQGQPMQLHLQQQQEHEGQVSDSDDGPAGRALLPLPPSAGAVLSPAPSAAAGIACSFDGGPLAPRCISSPAVSDALTASPDLAARGSAGSARSKGPDATKQGRPVVGSGQWEQCEGLCGASGARMSVQSEMELAAASAQSAVIDAIRNIARILGRSDAPAASVDVSADTGGAERRLADFLAEAEGSLGLGKGPAASFDVGTDEGGAAGVEAESCGGEGAQGARSEGPTQGWSSHTVPSLVASVSMSSVGQGQGAKAYEEPSSCVSALGPSLSLDLYAAHQLAVELRGAVTGGGARASSCPGDGSVPTHPLPSQVTTGGGAADTSTLPLGSSTAVDADGKQTPSNLALAEMRVRTSQTRRRSSQADELRLQGGGLSALATLSDGSACASPGRSVASDNVFIDSFLKDVSPRRPTPPSASQGPAQATGARMLQHGGECDGGTDESVRGLVSSSPCAVSQLQPPELPGQGERQEAVPQGRAAQVVLKAGHTSWSACSDVLAALRAAAEAERANGGSQRMLQTASVSTHDRSRHSDPSQPAASAESAQAAAAAADTDGVLDAGDEEEDVDPQASAAAAAPGAQKPVTPPPPCRRLMAAATAVSLSQLPSCAKPPATRHARRATHDAVVDPTGGRHAPSGSSSPMAHRVSAGGAQQAAGGVERAAGDAEQAPGLVGGTEQVGSRRGSAGGAEQQRYAAQASMDDEDGSWSMEFMTASVADSLRSHGKPHDSLDLGALATPARGVTASLSLAQGLRPVAAEQQHTDWEAAAGCAGEGAGDGAKGSEGAAGGGVPGSQGGQQGVSDQALACYGAQSRSHSHLQLVPEGEQLECLDEELLYSPVPLITPLRMLNQRPGAAMIGPLQRGILRQEAARLGIKPGEEQKPWGE